MRTRASGTQHRPCLTRTRCATRRQWRVPFLDIGRLNEHPANRREAHLRNLPKLRPRLNGGCKNKCDPGGSPLCDLIWNTHGIVWSRFRTKQQAGPYQMPTAPSPTLLWLRAAHGKFWLALLSCGRRGWLRQLTNQLTRFCAVVCPRSPVQFTSGPARSLASMNRCAGGPFRGHVSGPSSTRVARSGNNRSYMSVSVGELVRRRLWRMMLGEQSCTLGCCLRVQPVKCCMWSTTK